MPKNQKFHLNSEEHLFVQQLYKKYTFVKQVWIPVRYIPCIDCIPIGGGGSSILEKIRNSLLWKMWDFFSENWWKMGDPLWKIVKNGRPPPSNKWWKMGDTPLWPDTHPQWTEWMTHTCENSTFRHTSYVVGNDLHTTKMNHTPYLFY